MSIIALGFVDELIDKKENKMESIVSFKSWRTRVC